MKKFGKAILAFSFLLVFAGIAMAADNAVPGGFDSWKGLLKGVVAGAAVGGVVAYLGYLKNTDGAPFDKKKAAVTIVIGAISGALAGFEKKDLSKVEDWYQAGTTVLVAELLGKVGFRLGSPVIGGAVAKLLGKKDSA
jgi:hypothetical protein